MNEVSLIPESENDIVTEVESKDNADRKTNLPFDPRHLIDENGKLLKLLYTLQETAFLMSQSEKTIRRWIERGLLQTSPASRHKLVTRKSIEAFLKVTV
jgi:hypothetical protein